MSISNRYNTECTSSAQKYNFIEDTFTGFDGYTMPMSFVKLAQVQLSANTVTDAAPLGDNRSRHVKAFMAATVGAAFTAVARIIRIAVFSAFLIPAVLVRFATATRYGFDGAVPELFQKYGEEWIDAGVTVVCIPLGLAKTIDPKTFSDFTDTITNHYLNRSDRRAAFTMREAEAKARYEGQVEASVLIRDERVPVNN